MFKSIRLRIALPYTLLVTAAMVFLGIWFSRSLRANQLEQIQSNLIAESHLIADFLVSQLNGLATDQGEVDDLALQWAQTTNARVTIIDAAGEVIGESHENRLQMDNHLFRPEVQEALERGVGISIRFSQTVGYDLLYVCVPMTEDGVTVGFVRLSLPLTQIEQNSVKLRNNVAFATLILLIAMVLLATWIADRTTRPLRSLNEAVGEIAAGNLDTRLSSHSQDEVGQLTQAVDRMAQQINKQFQELHSEREKFSAVLEQMTDGVMLVDNDGEVVLLNSVARSLFGVAEDSPKNRSIIAVVRNHQIVDLWKKSQADSQTHIDVIELHSPRHILQVFVLPLGKVLSGNYLLLFQDMTHIRRLETIRRDFISNISHELRTPLASLKSLTETLLGGALEDPAVSKKFLALVEVEVDALSQMVSELLELSRVESGEAPFNMIAASPCDVLQQAVSRMEHQVKRANLDLSVFCEPSLPAIIVDPPRLLQVFINLIHNAIKFTPERGSIQIRAQQEDEMVHFAIQDSGVGISSEDLQRIFERFYKTDRARSGGGTGLGLAIARHIVEAHEGKIWVESQFGEGSTFHFTIPLAK